MEKLYWSIYIDPNDSEDESNQAFLEYICGSPEIWSECQSDVVSWSMKTNKIQ